MTGEMAPHEHYPGYGKHYIEPDYVAQDVDDQVPLTSKIGRGPRGASLFVRVVVDKAGEYVYELTDSITGEVVVRTPNLSAGQLIVTQSNHDQVSGETGYFTLTVKRGTVVESYEIAIPAGAVGSRVYTFGSPVKRDKSNVYQFDIGALYYDGQRNWADSNISPSGLDSKPYPRVNDVVMFYSEDNNLAYLAVGHINAVESGKVVVTVQTYVPTPSYYIGDNFHWWIGSTDTGVDARGIKGDKGTYGTPTIEEVGSYEPIEVIDLDSDPTNAKLHFKIPMAKMILIQAEVASVADLPPFSSTPIGYAYLVDHASDLQYDLYYRGPEPQPGTDWIVVRNWQGVPGKEAVIVTGDTHHLPMGEDARVVGTPASGNEVRFDFYIPDEVPSDLITGESPIEVTEEDSRFTIQHMRSGVVFGTYPNYSPPSLGFGDRFYIAKIQVDGQGHLYNAENEDIRIPDTLATQTDKGLMSPEDKAKLDDLDGIIPTADGTTIVDNDGVWSATQQDLTIPTITIAWIQENFVL